ARAVAARVQRVGEALNRVRGDAFLRDAARAVVTVSAVTANARALARAHRLYREIVEAYEGDRIADATALANRAVEAVNGSGRPFAEDARRYRAIGAYHTNDVAAALADIEDVAADARSRRYLRLVGLAQRLIGLIHLAGGDDAAGAEAYRVALASFRSAGDTDNEAATQTSIAERFELAGDTEQSWQARSAALTLIPGVRDPLIRYRALQGPSLSALRDDLPEAALHFQHAALENARRSGQSPAVIAGLLNRAGINNRLGHPQRVTSDLEDARRVLTSVKNPLLATPHETRLLLAHSDTLAADDPAETAAALESMLCDLSLNADEPAAGEPGPRALPPSVLS